MASVRLGSIVVDIRGSVGDETYARNQGGIYVRARTSPSQPASTHRDLCQATITALSQAWSGELDDSTRETWRTYAHQWPRLDKFGVPTITTGYLAFIRSNFNYYRSHQALFHPIAPQQPPAAIPGFNTSVVLTAALLTAGDPVPDCTGTYKLTTPYDHHLSWKHTGADYWIWWNQLYSKWYIATQRGGHPPYRWAGGLTPPGIYTPFGDASGNPSVAWNGAQQAVVVDLPPPVFDPPPSGLRLYASLGHQVTTGVNFHNGPWRFISENVFDGSDWTVEPWWIPHPWGLSAPGKVYSRLVAVLSDGATSEPTQSSALTS